MIEQGMCQNGKTACFQDNFNGPHGRDFLAGNKAGTPVADIAVKGFFQTFCIPMLQHIFGIVGTGDHAVGEFGGQFFVGYRNSVLCETTTHFLVADDAPVYKAGQTAFEKIAFIINIKTYDMDIGAFIF